MKASLQLGRFAGIRVQIHWTFWLLILFVVFMVYSTGGTLVDAVWSSTFIGLLFVCVVLHEFGHALTARRYGIGTRSITLLPIGGVATLKEIPEDPKAEFMVAIAGPAVNVVIALLLFPFVPLELFAELTPETVEEQLGVISGENLLFYLFAANGALVAFNMLPAFPLDGGRVLRAALSARMDRVRATQIAAALGKFLAFVFFFFGLFFNLILALIAVFIYFGAESENVMVTQLNLLNGYLVRDAMITRFSVLHPDQTLSEVVDVILEGTERDFIVSDESGIKGLLLMSHISDGVHTNGKTARVRDVMSEGAKILHPSDPLTDPYRLIRQGNSTFFPVVEAGELVGVIDMENINEFLRLRASMGY